MFRMAMLILCFAGVMQVSAPTPARACDENVGQLISGLLTPLIEQLPSGDLQLAAKWLLPRIQNDLGDLLNKAKLNDNDELRKFLADRGQADLANFIIKQGGCKWLLKELKKLSPRAADMLYRLDDAGIPRGVVPRALAALADSKRIESPTMEGLVKAWPLELTEADEEWLAIVCTEEWIAVKHLNKPAEPSPAMRDTRESDG